MNRLFKKILFFFTSLVVAAAVNLTFILQFLIITYATTIILYFLSGVLIKKKHFGSFNFLFLIPLFLLNLIALIINPETFPILSPVTFIIAFFAFAFGQVTKRKNEKNKRPLMFYLLLFATSISFIFFSLYFTPQFLYNKNSEKISDVISVYDKLEFSNLDGTPFELNALRNKTTLIDNWYLNCYQCHLKLPSLQLLANKIASDTTIRIISVINGRIDSLDKVIEFATNHKEIKFQILYDRQNSLSKIFKFDGYPVEIIIDKNGNFKERHDGFNKDERMIYVNETFKKLKAYNEK